MVNTVVSKERLRLAGRELRPAVDCQLFSDAECAKDAKEAATETFAASLGAFYDGPVGVAIDDNQIRSALVREIIRADLLERVLRW